MGDNGVIGFGTGDHKILESGHHANILIHFGHVLVWSSLAWKVWNFICSITTCMLLHFTAIYPLAVLSNWIPHPSLHFLNALFCFNFYTDFCILTFLLAEPSPLHTTTIVEKCTLKLVDEYKHMLCQATEPLATFLEYITYVGFVSVDNINYIFTLQLICL